MSEYTIQDAYHDMLQRWGYGEQDKAETQLREAQKRILELETELKVTHRFLDRLMDKACGRDW